MRIYFAWGFCMGVQGAKPPKTAVSGPGSDSDLNQIFTQTQQFLTAAQGVTWAQVRARRLQLSPGGHTGLCSAIQTSAATFDAFFSPLQLYGALPCVWTYQYRSPRKD